MNKIWPTEAAFNMYNQEKDKLFGSGTEMVEVRKNEGWSPLVSSTGSGSVGTTEKIKMDILICHCRENLDWLKGPDFRVRATDKAEITLLIYDKCRDFFYFFFSGDVF